MGKAKIHPHLILFCPPKADKILGFCKMNVGADVSVGPNPSTGSGQTRVDTEFHPYIMHLLGFILNRRQTGYPV